MILTAEIRGGSSSNTAEVAICFDDEGLERLLKHLTKLKTHRDHIHLKTPAWAGDDLTEKKQGSDFELVNHLMLVKK
jgi:hypothetical protein